MEFLTSLLAAAGTEALKVWGVFATLIILLGLIVWRLLKSLANEQAVSQALRAEIKDLQEKRVEDARQLIRVTNASTETVAARSEGDQRFATIMQALVGKVAQIEAAQSRSEESRELLEQLVVMSRAATNPPSPPSHTTRPPSTKPSRRRPVIR